MAGMGSVLAPLMDVIAPLIGKAIKAAMRTSGGMILLALMLLGPSFWLAAQGSAMRGLLACLLTLALCATFGVILAMKRAIGALLVAAVETARIGERSLNSTWCFMLEVQEAELHGERGNQLAQRIETLPLAEAEAILKRAVQAFLKVSESGGGLRGRLKRGLAETLFGHIESLTLAELRQESAASGGVDLLVVRDRMAAYIDARIVEEMQTTVRRFTYVLLLLSILLSLSGAFAIGLMGG